jgi:hypothetical protein
MECLCLSSGFRYKSLFCVRSVLFVLVILFLFVCFLLWWTTDKLVDVVGVSTVSLESAFCEFCSCSGTFQGLHIFHICGQLSYPV